MKNIFFTLSVALIGIISINSCKKTTVETDCDAVVVLSENEYEKTVDDHIGIKELQISGDCLHINFSSGGCNGNSWEVKLIDSEQIAESYPVQRFLKLSLKNEEDCLAIVTKEMSFDISELQLDSYDKVILNVSGESIEYDY